MRTLSRTPMRRYSGRSPYTPMQDQLRKFWYHWCFIERSTDRADLAALRAATTPQLGAGPGER